MLQVACCGDENQLPRNRCASKLISLTLKGASLSWSEGDWIVRREVLSQGPWFGTMVRVIEDTPERLVSYIPEGSPFGFAQGNWPTPDGKHPWSNRSRWTGHGCLMIQRPDDPYAIWHFWAGDKREFVCWYINLQEPFRRNGS